jgi:protein-S-isoprenylcysteine O-methyltransferase Ste14
LHPTRPRVVASPPLIYGLGFLAGYFLERQSSQRLLPPPTTRPLAGLLLVFGLAGLAALIQFRRAGTSPSPWRPASALVTDGLYWFSRNPMYLGFTFLYLAGACWLNSSWPMIILPAVLIIMQVGVIRREEAYLERTFGEEYREYRRQVRRWL